MFQQFASLKPQSGVRRKTPTTLARSGISLATASRAILCCTGRIFEPRRDFSCRRDMPGPMPDGFGGEGANSCAVTGARGQVAIPAELLTDNGAMRGPN
jgi:hypothetical protein